ncbi:hypothetical protein C8J57DRAFT_1515209 [Mycena rebaudengoi]|nr:hypothetical protein C8J57DRAFT_1515209 [Mycena rebaudengoi]
MAPEPPKEEPPDPVVLAVKFEVNSLFVHFERSGCSVFSQDGPPPAAWVRYMVDFAKQKSCLIDDYDQIHFTNWPMTIPCGSSDNFTYSWIWCLHRLEEPQSKGYQQDGGRERETADPGQTVIVVLKLLVKYISTASVPNMTSVVNGQDEPRVVFDYRALGAHDRGFNLTDETPFSIAPNSTSEFFNGQSGCNVAYFHVPPAKGPSSIVFLSSASTEFATDLFPVFSITKISPCFSDILHPSEQLLVVTKIHVPHDIKWSDKKSKLYWRGTSSGGQLTGWDFHELTRFKLPYFSQKHPDLADLALTIFISRRELTYLLDVDGKRQDLRIG